MGLTVAILAMLYFGAMCSGALIEHRARDGEDTTPAFLCLMLNLLGLVLNAFYLGRGFST